MRVPRIHYFILILILLMQGMAARFLVQSEVYAIPGRETVPVEGSCDDTPVTAFTPDLDYVISFVAGTSLDLKPSCSSTVTVVSPVNGDTTPGVTCDFVTGGSQGNVVIKNRMPTMKIGGLVCVTEDRSTLEVHGDGSDDPNIDISIQDVTTTSADPAKKVDDATVSSKDMLFGTGGQVSSSAIIDGQDNDSLTNGEVAFGGTVTSEGGSKVFVTLDVTGHDPEPVGTRETLTFTFTPQ